MLLEKVNILVIKSMKNFVQIPQHNNKDYLLVNLDNVIYIAVNDKAGSCKIFLREKLTITCMPGQAYILLEALERHRSDLEEYLTPATQEVEL